MPLPPLLTVFSLTFLPIVHNLLKVRNLGFALAVTLEDSAVVTDIEGSIVAFEWIGGSEMRGTESDSSEVLGWMVAVGLEGAGGVGVGAVCEIRVCRNC